MNWLCYKCLTANEEKNAVCSKCSKAKPVAAESLAASTVSVKTKVITAADIETELSRRDHGKYTSTQNIIILLLSLGLFVATGLLSASWDSVAVLIVVLLIHEFGHWLGMKFYGYRDLKMFFIPFFGAAVRGKESHVSSTNRAIIALLGPAPGILLGIISGFIYLKWKQPVFLQFGLMFSLINGVNLLPIYPLDGGQFMDTVIFSRHPVAEVVFKVLAALALAGLALSLSSIPLGILAAFTLLLTRETHFQGKLVRRLKVIFQGQNLPATENAPIEQLEIMLPELSVGLSSQNFKVRVKILTSRAASVWRRLSVQPPKLGPSLALMGVYGGMFLLGIAGSIGLIAAYKTSNEKTIITQRITADGKTVSFEEKYWKQQKIWEVQLNNEGLYDGHSARWTIKGVKLQEGTWAKGFWQGGWTNYDASENIKSIVTYDNGRPIKYQTVLNGELTEVQAAEWPMVIKLAIPSSPQGVHQKSPSN